MISAINSSRVVLVQQTAQQSEDKLKYNPTFGQFGTFSVYKGRKRATNFFTVLGAISTGLFGYLFNHVQSTSEMLKNSDSKIGLSLLFGVLTLASATTFVVSLAKRLRLKATFKTP